VSVAPPCLVGSTPLDRFHPRVHPSVIYRTEWTRSLEMATGLLGAKGTEVRPGAGPAHEELRGVCGERRARSRVYGRE